MIRKDKTSPQNMVPGLAKLIVGYFATTPAWMLPLHLIYIMVVSTSLTFAYVVAFHWSNILDVYREAHNVQEFGINLKVSVEADNKIQDLLKTFNDDAGGMRTYIYRYHNGLAAINGVPFFFQSNIHEIIAPGISRVLPYEQRIPVSINVAIASQFIQDKCIFISNTDGDPNSQNHYFWQSRGAKSLIRCPITMSNGDLFGFVGIDFASSRSQQDLQPTMTKLRIMASRLGEIYSSTKK